MAANRSDQKRRTRLSKAEIKAYEARRAAERRRLALNQDEPDRPERPESNAYSITRDDEFDVIKSDLVRLGWIVGVLTVLLAGATLVLS